MDFNSHTYDKAKWHYGADNFPKNMPEENGFTHVGFYLTWLVEQDLVGAEITNDEMSPLSEIKSRKVSPIKLIEIWDGCLIGDMLNETGNKFSYWYYENKYFDDFVDVFEDIYVIPSTWDRYDRLKPVLDKRFAKWLNSRSKKPWQIWK